jgi:Zn2+/Cd2+-exporting ATPase
MRSAATATATTTRTRLEYAVGGMDCPGCAASIHKAVSALPGVHEAEVDFLSGGMFVAIDASRGDSDDIAGTVRGLGFTVGAAGADASEGEAPRSIIPAVVLATGATFWLAGLGLGLVGRAAFGDALLIASLIVGGVPLLRSAARDLSRGAITIDVLMTIAVGGAIALGEWAEAATVVVLFALSELVEGGAIDRSRRAVDSLLALIPDVVTLVRDGSPVQVAVAEAVVGDTAMARPGERIALDGTVANGISEVNEAAISGESKLLVKEPGDAVFAGSLNGSGSLDYTVTQLADSTVVARILAHVREAQRSRAPVQRLVDKFARVYTPGMLAVATLTAAVPILLFRQPVEPWVYRALVLLVAGCPCAFVLATPVATASAMARLARVGVLVKGGAQLEALGSVRAVALDKTGTVTAGAPEVTRIVAVSGDSDSLLATAAAVEGRSEHVLARAIADEAARRGVAPAERCGVFASYPGKGATLTGGGANVAAGSTRLLDALRIPYAAHAEEIGAAEERGETVVLVAADGVFAGYIALDDAVRPHARHAVAALSKVGVRDAVMLTGDNAAVATRVSQAVGIDVTHSRLMPDDKVQLVRDLVARHGSAAMVGDGINDAPALAAATVGVAMGGSGTDVAIDTADIALMGDDLRRLPEAIGVARRTRRTIVANIAIAAGLKGAVMVLVGFGVATLWMAVVADVGLTLAVVGNSLRLLRAPRAKGGTA